jgi:hypothetical protein
LEPTEGKEKEKNVVTPGIGNSREQGMRDEERRRV